MRMNAEGIKIKFQAVWTVPWNGAFPAYKDGRIPLSTFRADIDYALAEAHNLWEVGR